MGESDSNSMPCKVGDILRVPVEKYRNAFARVVSLQDGWDLVQLYRVTSKSPYPSDEVTESDLLLPPLSFGLDDVEAGRLPVVSSDPDFVPKGLDTIEFRMGQPGNYRTIKVGEYRPGSKISDAEASLLPRMEFASFSGMLVRAREILDNASRMH